MCARGGQSLAVTGILGTQGLWLSPSDLTQPEMKGVPQLSPTRGVSRSGMPRHPRPALPAVKNPAAPRKA